MNWIHAPTEGNGMSPFQVMLDGVRGAGWLGHSFGGFVHDRGSGRGFNGQWGMAGEAGVSFRFFFFWEGGGDVGEARNWGSVLI